MGSETKETRRLRMTSLLCDAMNAVANDRMDDYGTPAVNYTRVSALWNQYLALRPRNGRNDIDGADAVIMMILVKIARLIESPDHRDTWLDIAGYAAVGWSVVEDGKREVEASDAISGMAGIRDEPNE